MSPVRACDVVVVGAGAMGSAAAWWLARRGVDVIVLEQFEAGHVRGSSHGSSRIFRLAYPDRRYVAMAQAALPLWHELADEAGIPPLLQPVGGIDFGDVASVGAVADALAAEGVVHTWLSPTDAAERWPGFSFSGSVLFQAEAASIAASQTLSALHSRAAALGAQFHFSTPVAAIDETPTGATVRTRAGDEVHARVAVIAGGAWAPRLVAGIEPITVTQEQVFHFAPHSATGPGSRAAGLVDAWPTFIDHRSPYIYGLPTPSPAQEGIKVAEHHAGSVVDPDTRDFVVDPASRARVIAYVERSLPGLDPVPLSASTCLYSNTANEDFVIERRGRLVIAAGFSGHGFKFTPLVGRQLADLAQGGG